MTLECLYTSLDITEINLKSKTCKENDQDNQASLSGHFPNKENDQFKDRLKLVIGVESVRSFASRAGLSPTVVRQYVIGKSFPTLENLIALTKTGGVNLLWLATGEGPKDSDTPLTETKLILDPSMPSGFNRSLVFIRKATTAVELMGKDAATERKVEAVEAVYKRLSETDGAADMIELMQLIQATLEGSKE